MKATLKYMWLLAATGVIGVMDRKRDMAVTWGLRYRH